MPTPVSPSASPSIARSPLELPRSADVIVIGAGLAGAATAAALAPAGLRGLILEREPAPGMHASGRNAAMARQVEFDPVIRALAVAGVRLTAAMEAPTPLLRRIGGLYLAGSASRARCESVCADLAAVGVTATLLEGAAARARFPVLEGLHFDLAIHCPGDGVIDVHALLQTYLERARSGGFPLATHTAADALVVEHGKVTGLDTNRGRVHTRLVVDASGAWAGRIGREQHPLPLVAMRRHLFVSDEQHTVAADAPIVWDLEAAYYFRPEGRSLLLSPCDETPHPPGEPQTDPAAEDLLAEKLTSRAPRFDRLGLRSRWACLRTFAPDRHPIVGPDPEIAGLFHVSGLGGFGVTTGGAIGEIAAARLLGRPIEGLPAGVLEPARFDPAHRR